MDRIIARGEIGYVRPWRLKELRVAKPVDTEPVAQEEVSAIEVEPIVLPTIAELEQLRDKGYEDGYAAGREEAFAQLSGNIKAITQGMERLFLQMAQIDDATAQFISGVGQVIAEVVEVVPPAQLAKRVERALGMIAQPEGLVLCMHPADVATLRECAPEVFAQPGVTLQETDEISQGGFMVRSASGEVNATLEAALQNLKKALLDASV